MKTPREHHLGAMIIPIGPANDYMDILVTPTSRHTHTFFTRGTRKFPFNDEYSVCKKDLITVRVSRGMALLVDSLLYNAMPRSHSSATTMVGDTPI